MNEETIEPIEEVTDAPVDAPETVEVTLDSPKKKKAPAVTEDVPLWVRAEAGESYLSLAVRYFPKSAPGIKAPELVTINRNRPLREGVKVFLKESK